MNLERIIGSIVKEQGAQPFVLNVRTGKFELGSFADPDEAQAGLNVIQQQRFAQLICERANVSFAQVRLGQYFCTRCKRWVDVSREPWGDALCRACSAEQASRAAEARVEAPAAPVRKEEMPPPAPAEKPQQTAREKLARPVDEDAPPPPEKARPAPVAEEEPKHTPSSRQPLPDVFTTGELLEKAIVLAVEAHRGQVDKAGMPYILHPLRMMARLDTPEAMMAAVLHDVVEDTAWTLDRLRAEGFPPDVLEAVEALTRYADETYEAFIERAARHPVACRVKLADLEDNMDVRRLDTLTKRDVERLQRYQKAWRRLRRGGE